MPNIVLLSAITLLIQPLQARIQHIAKDVGISKALKHFGVSGKTADNLLRAVKTGKEFYQQVRKAGGDSVGNVFHRAGKQLMVHERVIIDGEVIDGPVRIVIDASEEFADAVKLDELRSYLSEQIDAGRHLSLEAPITRTEIIARLNLTAAQRKEIAPIAKELGLLPKRGNDETRYLDPQLKHLKTADFWVYKLRQFFATRAVDPRLGFSEEEVAEAIGVQKLSKNFKNNIASYLPDDIVAWHRRGTGELSFYQSGVMERELAKYIAENRKALETTGLELKTMHDQSDRITIGDLELVDFASLVRVMLMTSNNKSFAKSRWFLAGHTPEQQLGHYLKGRDRYSVELAELDETFAHFEVEQIRSIIHGTGGRMNETRRRAGANLIDYLTPESADALELHMAQKSVQRGRGNYPAYIKKDGGRRTAYYQRYIEHQKDE